MMNDPVAIARACYEAYVAKDRPAIEALIADDFHFSSPLDNQLDRATYFERCWPNSETIKAFEFVHVVRDGEQVFVTYEAQSSGGRRFRNTEIITVRGSQIVEVEVYFGWDLQTQISSFTTTHERTNHDQKHNLPLVRQRCRGRCALLRQDLSRQ